MIVAVNETLTAIRLCCLARSRRALAETPACSPSRRLAMIRSHLIFFSKRSGPFNPSIPSSAEQRGARIEGCGKRGESLQTRTLRYGLHFISAYSGCFMVIP